MWIDHGQVELRSRAKYLTGYPAIQIYNKLKRIKCENYKEFLITKKYGLLLDIVSIYLVQSDLKFSKV